MKKLYYIFLALFTFSFGCEQEDVFELEESNTLVYFPTTSVNETAILTGPGQIVQSSITVTVIGDAPSSELEVAVIVAEASTAIEGVHYNLPSSSVVIPAGEFSTELEYEVILDGFESVDDVRTLILELQGSATSGVAEQNLSVNISMNISCPIPETIYGTYDVVTTDTNPAGCSGVTNVVTIEPVEGSITGISISDITGGIYKNCYGADDNPGVINYKCGEIILDEVPDVVYGSDTFNGSGLYDPSTGEITITFSNSYGDSGTSVLVKQ